LQVLLANPAPIAMTCPLPLPSHRCTASTLSGFAELTSKRSRINKSGKSGLTLASIAVRCRHDGEILNDASRRSQSSSGGETSEVEAAGLVEVDLEIMDVCSGYCAAWTYVECGSIILRHSIHDRAQARLIHGQARCSFFPWVNRLARCPCSPPGPCPSRQHSSQ
jgi:hypothetical protein